jgi:transposase
MGGAIISESGAASFRYEGRHHPGIEGRLPQESASQRASPPAHHQERRTHAACTKSQSDPSGIYAMQRFAKTIRQDLAAARNAVSEPWSNGQTEGQINKLKTLKRAMYGRAGVELLRARMTPL